MGHEVNARVQGEEGTGEGGGRRRDRRGRREKKGQETAEKGSLNGVVWKQEEHDRTRASNEALVDGPAVALKVLIPLCPSPSLRPTLVVPPFACRDGR